MRILNNMRIFCLTYIYNKHKFYEIYNTRTYTKLNKRVCTE